MMKRLIAEYNEVLKMQKDLKRFGFGFMRLPYKKDNPSVIDFDEVNKMVDRYIESGGNYFDTGYSYLGGKSETSLRECVIKRYPRDRILIADKMPVYEMSKDDDPYEIFQTQLERCGVDYFDYYLVHDPENKYYEGICKDLDIFNILNEFKLERKIRKLGMSLHDTPEVLDKILTEHPEIEFVQLQINYDDWNSIRVQARANYEICLKHEKPVFIMEPIQGGKLANVNENVMKVFNQYDERSPAQWALSFVFNLDNVDMILSGMHSLKDVEENTRFVKEFNKLNVEEMHIINKARDIMQNNTGIDCRYCNYCKEKCTQKIPISTYFQLYNQNKQSLKIDENTFKVYDNLVNEHPKASDCVKCGKCEEVCPQHIKIRKELEKIALLFEY